MIQVKCIHKLRDKNNKIYGYCIQDLNGQTQDIQPDNLKQAIIDGQIHVVNLTLTKDGRLVNTTEHHLQSKKLGPAPQKQPNIAFSKKFGKAKVLKLKEKFILAVKIGAYPKKDKYDTNDLAAFAEQIGMI